MNSLKQLRTLARQTSVGGAELLGPTTRAVWIYGAGTFGRDVAAALNASGTPVKGFIEKAPRSSSAWGHPITALVIYGAGAHTARILPMMAPSMTARIATIIDGNPNLHGKQIGEFLVNPPSVLEQHPNATVVISSYRSQEPIAKAVAQSWSNPVCRLYPPPPLSRQSASVSGTEYAAA
jgi:hypothetical protein